MDKNLSIYYHIWSPPNTDLWKLMVDEQLKRIYRSGILDKARFYCAINGKQGPRIAEFVSLYDWVRVLEVSDTDDHYEGFTLKHLYEECTYNPNIKVLYFHTKGATRDELCVQSWRLMMEYFVIDKWEECIKYLDTYTSVGVQMCRVGPSIYPDGTIQEENPTIVYAGNFWWANSSYINTLRTKYLDDDCRYAVEKWIGDSDISNPKDLYTHPDFDRDPMSYNYANYHKEDEYIK